MRTTLRGVLPAAMSGSRAANILGLSRAVGETMIVTLVGGSRPNLTLDPREGMQAMTAYIATTAGGENPVGRTSYNTLFAVGLLLFVITLIDQHPSACRWSDATGRSTDGHDVRRGGRRNRPRDPGRDRDRTDGSMVFLLVLVVLAVRRGSSPVAPTVSTAIDGAPRFDKELLTNYSSDPPSRDHRLPRRHPRQHVGDARHRHDGGAPRHRGGPAPRGVREPGPMVEPPHRDQCPEPGRRTRGRLRALAVAFVTVMGIDERGLVISGAVALSLLILPVIIITTREAVRAVPREIRDGSLALGATKWQTTWRQTLPSAIPGIATGTILGLSRAMGEAAPLLLIGTASAIRFDPNGLFSQFTALPLEIYSTTSQSREDFRVAAAGAIIVLLIMILAMNGLAIFIQSSEPGGQELHSMKPPTPRPATCQHRPIMFKESGVSTDGRRARRRRPRARCRSRSGPSWRPPASTSSLRRLPRRPRRRSRLRPPRDHRTSSARPGAASRRCRALWTA